MKNADIHKGLPQWEIRSLIAHELETVWNMEMENKCEVAPYSKEDTWGYVIQDCKNQIKFHQQRMKIAELRKGLSMVIANHGWEEWDVSDETTREAGQKMALSFIGTKAEYNHLLEIINGV